MQCSHFFWQMDKDLQRAIMLASHTFLSKKASQRHCVCYYQKPGKGPTGLCSLWVRTRLVSLEREGAVPPRGQQLLKAEQHQEPLSCPRPPSTISSKGLQAVAQQLSPLAHPREETGNRDGCKGEAQTLPSFSPPYFQMSKGLQGRDKADTRQEQWVQNKLGHTK